MSLARKGWTCRKDVDVFSAENKNSHFFAQKFLAGKQKSKHYSSIYWNRKRRQTFSLCKMAKNEYQDVVQERGWRKMSSMEALFQLILPSRELWCAVYVYGKTYVCASVVFTLIYGPADRQSTAISWHTNFVREIISVSVPSTPLCGYMRTRKFILYNTKVHKRNE